MSTVERDNAGTAVQLPSEVKIGEATNEPRVGTEVAADGTTATLSAEKNDRDYVVLKREKQESPNSPLTWTFVANIGATSAEQAVRRAAETPGTSFLNPDGPTTLVAIPARSFNPITVAVQTTTSIILS